ncbi:MAG: hypothetical protein KDK02_13520 [Rhodobacteraceae bacterium]|nr:hypothetical protein [Paracoccaceae bacterium]
MARESHTVSADSRTDSTAPMSEFRHFANVIDIFVRLCMPANHDLQIAPNFRSNPLYFRILQKFADALRAIMQISCDNLTRRLSTGLP